MVYPYYQEVSYHDPIAVLAHFADRPGTVFLDSASALSHQDPKARYGFLGIDPFQILLSKNGQLELNGKKFAGNPFDVLQNELSKFPLAFHDLKIPFQGGTIGYFSYDLHQHLEKIPGVQDDLQFYDMALGFYDLIIAFDYIEKRAWIFSSGYPAKEAEREKRAAVRLQTLLEELLKLSPLKKISDSVITEKAIQSNFTRPGYMSAVEKVKNYILAGDLFEANISQCFHAELSGSVMDLYRKLRTVNPAPFSAYISLGDAVLLSASPERFLKLSHRQVETRPIKGTRRRSKIPAEDAALARELLQSEKDHAENIMIVDLLRNDLSRVCKPFSVQVPQLCGLESYATVHHLVSVIEGELQDALTAVDLLRATFPGGSITGAPKVRAMEIIAEIEERARGPYCGAIGYMGFNGDMDTSITIRTFAIKNNRITFQSGGAVTLDSDPASEYEETLIKSKALRRALCESITD